MRRIFALLLAAALLLTGCGKISADSVMQKLTGFEMIRYEDMQYTRPDLNAVQESLEAVRQAAQGTDTETLVDRIYDFYDIYDNYHTNYALADLGYCADMTDLYWSEEYGFCMEHSSEVEAALEELYYILAQSPCREELEQEKYFGAGYFDSYDGENLWDGEFTDLLEQEAQLQNRYYELSENALDYEYGSTEYYDACYEEMAQVLAELIRVRQEQAAQWNYDSYPEFASDYYYYRDYTNAQTDAYLEEIKKELVPLYRQVNVQDLPESVSGHCSEEETFRYVRKAAKNMGGTVEKAFDLLEEAGLYDIAPGENKYSSSFEIYLTAYYEPFVFVSPIGNRYDCLTFAHEFGHFCNDYASWGSYAGADVMEIFSQGMEYLSLCYGEDTQDLEKLKMMDSLFLYVEQAAYARFEQEMYSLKGDELTAENLLALYERTVLEYGFDSITYDSREFVDINHLYTNPMYIISYVVSNDAAMQLYQMEKQETGAGLRCYEENLDTEAQALLEFLNAAGLQSPFAEGRVAGIRESFEKVLN